MKPLFNNIMPHKQNTSLRSTQNQEETLKQKSMILKRSCNLTFRHAFDNIRITGIDNAVAAYL